MQPLRMLQAYRSLLASQWLDRDRLRALQEEKLRRLIPHAYATVPHYRRLFDEAGIDPSRIRTLEDLTRVPITAKPDLQTAEPGTIVSSAYRLEELTAARTTGSTGRPMTTYYDARFLQIRNALFLRALTVAGYRLGRHRMMLITDERAKRSRPLLRWRYVSDEETPERMLAEFRAFRPHVLYGLVTPLRQMVLAARAEGATLPRLDAVITTAESLDPGTRRLLGEAFQAPVFDIYGLTEMGPMAWECPHHAGYHLSEDTAVIELVPTGHGDSHSLVITNLELYGMPLIRYRTGDLARRGPEGRCACGRRLARLEAVEGRAVDAVRLRDGQTVSPYRITVSLGRIPGFQRYQVIQHDLSTFTVRFESPPEREAEVARDIRTVLASIVGSDAVIEPRREPSLDPPPGRKFRTVECRLPA
ncbi:phenylacetate--CoA ligase family protein [Benzoatithermus flavus]|uniref:Phenylacetate--CoA ligase family protein n=1 Tax=Benzoatithermus flavus TaxID=3108223 RepID=A0ABU8XSI9_9PROT